LLWFYVFGSKLNKIINLMLLKFKTKSAARKKKGKRIYLMYVNVVCV